MVMLTGTLVVNWSSPEPPSIAITCNRISSIFLWFLKTTSPKCKNAVKEPQYGRHVTIQIHYPLVSEINYHLDHQHHHHYHHHGHHHSHNFHHLKKVRGGRWLAQVWVETCSSAHSDHSSLWTEVWFDILRLVALLETLHAPDDKLVSGASLDSVNQVVVRTRAVPVTGFHLNSRKAYYHWLCFHVLSLSSQWRQFFKIYNLARY